MNFKSHGDLHKQHTSNGVHLDDELARDFPRQDCGENFFWSIVTLPFRVLIGAIPAKQIDHDLAKRGVLDGEYDGDDRLPEILDEHTRKFLDAGRKH